MSSKRGRYEIFRCTDDLWYFNRIAGNGEVEHPSEGYVSRGNAVRAIGTCMEDTSHYVITDREEQVNEFEETEKISEKYKPCAASLRHREFV